ncbi:MAG: type II toxin-antitoxin system VapC family toxin [Isosphaeraceae bacterium]
MARLVFLDSGPLGLASQARGKFQADRCRGWLRMLLASGVRVIVPEIADYEVRRELTRSKATAGLRRPDQLVLPGGLEHDPPTTAAMRRAAEVWAEVRWRGMPTASDPGLDADCILAAQALLAGSPADVVIIATTNVGHLSRFIGVNAQVWDTIA